MEGRGGPGRDRGSGHRGRPSRASRGRGQHHRRVPSTRPFPLTSLVCPLDRGSCFPRSWFDPVTRPSLVPKPLLTHVVPSRPPTRAETPYPLPTNLGRTDPNSSTIRHHHRPNPRVEPDLPGDVPRFPLPAALRASVGPVTPSLPAHADTSLPPDHVHPHLRVGFRSDGQSGARRWDFGGSLDRVRVPRTKTRLLTWGRQSQCSYLRRCGCGVWGMRVRVCVSVIQPFPEGRKDL